ncbi:MAG: glycosyltransferase family 39 protein, partial [Bacteroidota bacterium]
MLLTWLVINLLQAAFTPLDADETYYWMYASQLDWGYFDHPPAVAVLIKLGMDWLPGALGLRLGHVLASTVTIAGMWYLLERPQGPWLWLGAALVFAQPFLNVYGFIATPDGPLLLFTVLYLLAYRRFLALPNLANGALWGLTMAGLLYAKYHGVMLIFFSVLPHLFWLLRQPGAWVAALGGAALYAPHLYWQYANDYPSFRYHLKGRNDAYKFKYTTEYLLNQLLIFSPLLVWFYGKTLYHFRNIFWARTQVESKDQEATKVTDGSGTSPSGIQESGSELPPNAPTHHASWADRAFLRVNYWLIAGFFLFFLYSTTKGGTEAQWTALLSMPLCYLTFRAVRD